MNILTRRYGPLAGWAWLLIIAGVAYIYLRMRSNQANAAAAAQAQSQGLSTNLGTVPVSNLTTQAQPMPIQTGDTFVSTTVPNTVNVSPSTTVNNCIPPAAKLQVAPPPTPSPAVNVKPPAPSQAYGLVNTVQGLMEWLGVNTAGSKIFNVGGGAPVYFGNASALATGAQYEQPGYDIYTPVGYANQVSQTATTLAQPYVAGR